MTLAPPDGEADRVPGELREWREPGEYGRYGWTEKAGMPTWHAGSTGDD